MTDHLTPEQVKALFPGASKSCLRVNAGKVEHHHQGGSLNCSSPPPRANFQVALSIVEEELNDTEKRLLAKLRSSGYAWVGIQCLTFRIYGKRTKKDKSEYTPDFVTIGVGGEMKLWDAKGPQVWEDSIQKMKSVATLYPWLTIIKAQWKDGEWKEHVYKP